MEYYEAANFLFDLRRFQVDPGTESIRELLAHLDDPHEDVTFVQIAGSNGKGSVARMVESTLRADGRRVGLFTSPHFEDLRERIRVDGRKVPESAVTAFVEATKPWLVDRAAAGEPLTFFEVVTAMALWRFGRADADLAVLEAGMGGELDATSVVDPTAAAVTNVALEHTSVLGETVQEIAESFAPIAPADRPLVTAADGEGLATLRAEAGDVVTVQRIDDETLPDATPDVTASYDGHDSHQESRVSVAGADWSLDARVPLLGAYQATNAGVATALVRQLGVTDEGTIRRGLRNAHWPGRFEVMDTDPLVVLDGAHNPAACEAVAGTLAEFDYDDCHLVFGALHDKDHREMAAALPETATLRTCAPVTSRAEDPETLARVFEGVGDDDCEVIAGSSVAGELDAARAAADADDAVLLTGSLYAVAEARTTWTRTVTPVAVDDGDDATALLARTTVDPDGIDRPRDDTVHHVVTTRVAAGQATRLREAALAAGGTCATSGLDTGGQLHDVVLAGTRSEFRTLLADLRERGHGLPGVADDVAASLDPDDEKSVATGTDANPYPWDDGTAVMGVVNVTPDSFHDGGDFYDVGDAVEQARGLVDAGVEVIDVGGESTRPGADPVAATEEIERIVPVIEAVDDATDALISVDTRKAEVAEAALDAGADVLNDVTGLEDPAMRFLAADREVPVIVMHSIDAPVDPSREVEYDDVVADVIDELTERVLLAEKAGIPRERVIVDPGLGFGKTAAESFELLGRLDELHALGCPVLAGHSHKSMFEFVGGETGDALAETIAGTAVAAASGADIVRVHDAAENVQAVRVAAAADDPAAFAERFDGS